MGQHDLPGKNCLHRRNDWIEQVYKVDSDRIIGVAPIGYADDYPARIVNRFLLQVGVRLETGEAGFAPVEGQVNMDQITIDLTTSLNTADWEVERSCTGLSRTRETTLYTSQREPEPLFTTIGAVSIPEFPEHGSESDPHCEVQENGLRAPLRPSGIDFDFCGA